MRVEDERMMGLLRRRCREGMGVSCGPSTSSSSVEPSGAPCGVLCCAQVYIGVSAVRDSTFGQLCSKPLEACRVLQELHQFPHLVLGLFNLAATRVGKHMLVRTYVSTHTRTAAQATCVGCYHRALLTVAPQVDKWFTVCQN